MELYSNQSQFTPDSIFAGNQIPALVKGVNLAPTSGGIYFRGSALMASVGGNAELLDISKLSSTFTVLDTAVTETKGKLIVGILTDDIEVPTEGIETTGASIYVCGYFHGEALIFADGTTAQNAESELRKSNIFID